MLKETDLSFVIVNQDSKENPARVSGKMHLSHLNTKHIEKITISKEVWN